MERRQRAAGFGQWERSGYGNTRPRHPAQFQDGATRYPPPGGGVPPRVGLHTEYQNGRPQPRILQPDSASEPVGPWHNRPHNEGPGRPQQLDPLMGFRQHGAPQYGMYTQSGPSTDSFRQQLPQTQHGDFQTSSFHHENMRSDSMHKDKPSPDYNPSHQPMLQTEGVGDFNYGGSHSNTSSYRGHQQSMSQQKGEHTNTPQNGSQPLQSTCGYRKESSGILGQGGPQQNLLEYRAETQSIVQDRCSQKNMSHQGERPHNIQQHRDSGSAGSHQITQKSGVSSFAETLSKDNQFGGQQQGRLHNDPPQNKNQFDGSFSDIGHHSSVQQAAHQFGDPKTTISAFGGSQTGAFSADTPLIRPLLNDTSLYSAQSPVIGQQCSAQLPAIQTAPYVQGQQNFLPFHGNLTNPAFTAPPPMSHVFSGFHKDVDLKALCHQPQVIESQNSLNQKPLNMHRDRFENTEMFNTNQKDIHLHPGVVPGQKVQQTFCQKNGSNEGHFLQQDIPDPQRDPHFLPQHRFSDYHGRLFVPHNTPNLQVKDNLTHLKGTSGVSDKDAFQQWLSCFLACKRKKLSPELDATQSISITDARGLIYGALQLVSQLDTLCQVLENRSEAGESWTQDYEKASDIRRELERKMKELEKPGYIQCVHKKLDRIRKKRQRRRQAAEEEEKEAKERAAEKEAVIDRWRMQRVQAVEEKKRERELKAAADSVLSEVRKKQTDAKKMLDVLKSLEKLRKLRKEAAGRKGVFPPASADDTFKNHTDRLRTMVHKRVALYDAEERALRVILEGEQEEERKRDKDKRLKKDKEKVLQKQRELDSILFGDPELLPNLHPLQPFRQYYLQAEQSVVSLVQIRHAWDQFSVPPDHPDASSIPRGWVVPALPSSDIWATALKQAE